MRPKRKEWTLMVPRPLPEVWNFFSRPENLNELTPDHVSFQFLTPLKGVEMYPGMVIQYQISPLLGIPMNWITEITQIKDQQFFIDDQRVGPYALWHHQHHFEAVEGGTKMTDILHYQVPLGPLGSFANWLFVERMVDEIFSYREEAVARLFG
ncbi:MAG: SRPBCC family protein [Bacteroidota bacterium]